MLIYGYHRTSTEEQHLDRGIKEITEYCENNNLKIERIFTDQQTGKNFNRPRYTVLKNDVLRKNDILIISELDRLGRNKNDTLKELQDLKEKGVRVMILEIPTTLVDYSKFGNDMANMMMETINNMLIEMYAVLAHAEMEKRIKRQREGIEAKKERGEWSDYGRPRVMELKLFKNEYQNVIDGIEKPFECMKRLGMTKPTFYRYVKKVKETL